MIKMTSIYRWTSVVCFIKILPNINPSIFAKWVFISPVIISGKTYIPDSFRGNIRICTRPRGSPDSPWPRRHPWSWSLSQIRPWSALAYVGFEYVFGNIADYFYGILLHKFITKINRVFVYVPSFEVSIVTWFFPHTSGVLLWNCDHRCMIF